MIIDKLYEAVEEKGNVCVGLDTSLDYIPTDLIKSVNNIEEVLFQFNRNIIDATLDVSACFKVQIAYYEAYGIEGLKAYKRTLEYIRSKKSIVIADIKRGDIAKTAEMYAKAHFHGDFESDFITINPYMGFDSLDPYLNYVKSGDKGIFVLLRTSNQGAKDIQYLTNQEGEKIYNYVGDKLQALGKNYLGQWGYSSIGAVVGGTHTDEGIEIRSRLDKTFFLIPGYGAQGGGAREVAIYLKNGNGGIVNSSRAIILAYKKHENGEKSFAQWAREEVMNMREAITDAVKLC